MNAFVSATSKAVASASPIVSDFRRFTIGLIGLAAIPPLALSAFIVLVDPYYLFGTPDIAGINVVRPRYEHHDPTVKPYQVRRIKPEAVVLGSSRAEVALDPQHPGWNGKNVFNFSLPSATSYEVMLAFLHAQSVAPLKQAVIGLDFFGFNIFAPRNREYLEARFAREGAEAFADFLAPELAKRRAGSSINPSLPVGTPEPEAENLRESEPRFLGEAEATVETRESNPDHPPTTWNEALYLRIYADVAAEVQRGTFRSGYQHYLEAGRAEGRQSGTPPPGWDDARYLRYYPDVAAEVRRGTFINGYHHYLLAGRAEGRRSGTPPRDWNEELYLRLHPDVAAEIRRGKFIDGYHHYLLAGRAEGREAGITPLGWNDKLYLSINPDAAAEVRRGYFINGYHQYLVVGHAEKREAGIPPSDWSDPQYLQTYPDAAAEVRQGTFVNGYHHYLVIGRREGRQRGILPRDWNEKLYLLVNPDVQSKIVSGTYGSGYHHYLVAGKSEHRMGGFIPPDWHETSYLQTNLDVEYQVGKRTFLNGYHHYLVAGHAEKRIGGFRPRDWSETNYLSSNPIARIRVALGDYIDGYAHYASVGQKQQLAAGIHAYNLSELLQHHWTTIGRAIFQFWDVVQLVFSSTAVNDALATLRRQSEPANFDNRGMRVWRSQDDVLRNMGGTGRLFRDGILNSQWDLWLNPPRYQYCFSNPDTQMSSYDAYRFMLRRAYERRTDLRLFMTPLHASVRQLFVALGLSERYESWQKELVRINEEEATRAGRKPLPLWDFSIPSSITRESVPAAADLTPMRWYWEYSHYRSRTGDLILDRVLENESPERHVPTDFGVRLTSENIDGHIARSRTELADWAFADSEFATKISAITQNPNVKNRQAQANCR